MPTRRSSVPGLSVDALTVCEILSFTTAWAPPADGRPRHDERFASWAAFLHVYELVRDALGAAEPAGAAPLFGERVRAYAQRHGLPALCAASYQEIREEPVQ